MVEVDRTKVLLSHGRRCGLGQVSLAGYGRDSTGVPPRPMRVFGAYAIVLLLHGGGRYLDARGTDRRVRAGDCIIVLPDLAHAYYRTKDQPRWDELYVTFSGPVFDLWRSTGLLREDNLVHSLAPIEYWHARLQRCVSDDPLIAVTQVQRFLGEVLSVANRPQERDAEWLLRAEQLIGVGARPDWHAVAAGLDCGYESFRRRFTKLTGSSPARFHAQRVIEHACELLADPDRSIRDIAVACGFCDEFHFSRRFKQIMGVRPGALRERLVG